MPDRFPAPGAMSYDYPRIDDALWVCRCCGHAAHAETFYSGYCINCQDSHCDVTPYACTEIDK